MIVKLEFFIALAHERHFGRAAGVCGVTQPTLPAGIKQLEESFGVLLVNRGSRFVGLTAEGERALEWARRIVADTRAMRDEIRSLNEGLVGHLRIAAVPTALAMVPSLTTPYRERHPGVRFTVLSRNSAEILGLLEDLEIDAGLTYLDNEPLGRVRALPLYRERYRLLTSPGTPLSDRERVTWAEVARAGIVVLSSRLSVELVQKAAMIGAPVLVAVSAPTALAVRTAEAAGITLVGVGRGDGFEVFTGTQRISRTSAHGFA